MRNKASGEQQIASCRHVVSSFIPEIREAQQGDVQHQQHRKEECKNQRCRIPAPPIEVCGHRSRFSAPARPLPSGDPA